MIMQHKLQQTFKTLNKTTTTTVAAVLMMLNKPKVPPIAQQTSVSCFKLKYFCKSSHNSRATNNNKMFLQVCLCFVALFGHLSHKQTPTSFVFAQQTKPQTNLTASNISGQHSSRTPLNDKPFFSSAQSVDTAADEHTRFERAPVPQAPPTQRHQPDGQATPHLWTEDIATSSLAAPKVATEFQQQFLLYSNSTGALLPCRAVTSVNSHQQHQHQHQHKPLQSLIAVTWFVISRRYDSSNKVDTGNIGSPVTQSSRVRHVLADGSLRIAPFAAEDFDAEVHSAAYQCCLSNSLGASCSSVSQLEAVIDEPLAVEVFDEFVIANNNALLKCLLPSTRHSLAAVHVLSWTKNNVQIASSASASSLSLSASFNNNKQTTSATKNSKTDRLADNADIHSDLEKAKYLMLTNGELLVRNVTKADAGGYKCRVRSHLTQDIATNKVPAQLMVDDSNSSAELRLVSAASVILAQENELITWCAGIQSHPAPKFSWFFKQHDTVNTWSPILSSSSNLHTQIYVLDACIIVPKAQQKHSGAYLLEANSQSSPSESLRVFVHLLVVPTTSSPVSSSTQTKALKISAPNIEIDAKSSLPTPQATGNAASNGNIVLYAQPLPLLATTTTTAATATEQDHTMTLNCSLTNVHLAALVESIVWLKDGALVSRVKLQNNFATSRSSTPPGQNTLANNVIIVKRDTTTSASNKRLYANTAGHYQCQVVARQPEVAARYLLALAETYSDSSAQTIAEKTVAAASMEKITNLAQLEARIAQLLATQAFAGASIRIDSAMPLITPSKPVLVQTFNSDTLATATATATPTLGKQLIRLRCVARAVPIPKISWFFNDAPIGDQDNTLNDNIDLPEQTNAMISQDFFNFKVSTTTSFKTNELASVLVASVARPSHALGGFYKCVASNTLGAASHVAFVSVPASSAPIEADALSPTANVTLRAVASSGTHTPSSFATLMCPAAVRSSSSPLVSVRWLRNNLEVGGTSEAGGRVALDAQQQQQQQKYRVWPIQNNATGHLDILNPDESDAGHYECIVTAAGANYSSGASTTGSDDVTITEVAHKTNNVAVFGIVNVRVVRAPQIDVQSLPEVVRTTEGLRTKLVCAVVSGDEPISIRWLRRRAPLTLRPADLAPQFSSSLHPEYQLDADLVASSGQSLSFSESNNDEQAGDATTQRSGAANKDVVLDVLGGLFEQMPAEWDTSSSAIELHKQQQQQSQEELAVVVRSLDDSSLVTFKKVSINDAGHYACVAQNAAGRATRVTRLYVDAPPLISLSPRRDEFALAGTSARLDCVTSGTPSPIVSWKKGVVGLANPSVQWISAINFATNLDTFSSSKTGASRVTHLANNSLLIEDVELGDAGLYACEATNGVGVAAFARTRLTVHVAPRFKSRVSTQLARASQLRTDKAQLKCYVYQGDSPLTFAWRRVNSTLSSLSSFDAFPTLNTPYSLFKADDHQQQLNRVKVHQQTEQSSLSATSSQHYDSVLTIEAPDKNDNGLYACSATNLFGADTHFVQLVILDKPEAPSAVRIAQLSARHALLSFKEPLAGNSAIKKYAVILSLPTQPSSLQQQASNKTNKWQTTIVEPTQPIPGSSSSNSQNFVTISVCCLQPFTFYSLRLRAINEVGESDASELVQFLTDEEAIGGPPRDVTVDASGAHSLKVTWRAPALWLQNGLVRGYYIGYKAMFDSNTANYPQQAATGSSNTIIQQQHSNIGDQLVSMSSNFAIDEQFQYKNVQLDMTTMPPQQPNYTNESNEQTQLSTKSLASQHQVFATYLTNLRRKTSYAVIVQAYNKVGAGPRSDTIVVQTLDAVPPIAPLLKVSNVRFTSAQFTWLSRRFKLPSSFNSDTSYEQETLKATNTELVNSADDNFDGEEFDDPSAFYTLSYKADEQYQRSVSSQLPVSINSPPKSLAIGNEQLAATDSWQQVQIKAGKPMPTLNVTGLRCGRRHVAFMTASNSLGQSEPGALVHFATLGGAPIAPRSAKAAILVNNTTAVLKFSEWQANGCAIASFLIKYKAPSQRQWTIVEHQVTPSVQTVVISGVAVFATSYAATPSPLLQQDNGQQLIKRPYAQAHISRGEMLNSQQHQQQQQQQIQKQWIADFVIQNLVPNSSHKLFIEATSESGSSELELDVDTTNSTAVFVSVTGSGESPADVDNLASQDNVSSNDNFDTNKAFSFVGGLWPLSAVSSISSRSKTTNQVSSLAATITSVLLSVTILVSLVALLMCLKRTFERSILGRKATSSSSGSENSDNSPRSNKCTTRLDKLGSNQQNFPGIFCISSSTSSAGSGHSNQSSSITPNLNQTYDTNNCTTNLNNSTLAPRTRHLAPNTYCTLSSSHPKYNNNNSSAANRHYNPTGDGHMFASSSLAVIRNDNVDGLYSSRSRRSNTMHPSKLTATQSQIDQHEQQQRSMTHYKTATRALTLNNSKHQASTFINNDCQQLDTSRSLNTKNSDNWSDLSPVYGRLRQRATIDLQPNGFEDHSSVLPSGINHHLQPNNILNAYLSSATSGYETASDSQFSCQKQMYNPQNIERESIADKHQQQTPNESIHKVPYPEQMSNQINTNTYKQYLEPMMNTSEVIHNEFATTNKGCEYFYPMNYNNHHDITDTQTESGHHCILSNEQSNVVEDLRREMDALLLLNNCSAVNKANRDEH